VETVLQAYDAVLDGPARSADPVPPAAQGRLVHLGRGDDPPDPRRRRPAPWS
jgi:hypothetical protein